MLKILVMAALIFAGMVAWDNVRPEQRPDPGITARQSATTKELPEAQEQHSAEQDKMLRSILLACARDLEQWPPLVQKFFRAMNLDEVIDPIRQRPDWTPLDDIPQAMRQALIAIEDHDFYQHGPIAIDGVLRATLINISAGEVVQGGSTLTQQLVKNVFLTHEQSMERKVEEALLAIMLEQNYSKDEILELYLNTAYYGAGATGLTQASRVYFGTSPARLTLAEAACLAALPYAPSALNPLENPAGCKKRQLLVIAAMQKYGFLSQKQAEEAKASPVILTNGTAL